MSILDFAFKRMKLTDQKEQITRNLFWSVIGKITTLAGSLLVGIIIARYLGPEKYGLMNYVTSFVALFQILALFGLDNIEIREEAKGKYSYQTIIGTSFIIKMVLAILSVALSIITSLMMEADRFTVTLIAIFSLSMIANTFSVCRNYFMAIVQNEYVVKSEILRTILGVGIKVALLLLNADLIWFIIAAMIDYYILAIGYITAYKSKIGMLSSWRYDKNCAIYLLKESFPLLITSAAVIIYQRIDQVMIGTMVGKEEVGYFSVASRIVEILIYIPTIIVQTIIPVLTKIRITSKQEYDEKSQRFMNLTIWCTFVGSLLTSICANWIVYILFGKQYLSASYVLSILAFKATLVAISSTAGNMIVLEGKQKYVIFRDLMGCIICIGMNYYLLPIYGIIASAIITLVSNFIAGYISDLLIPPYRKFFSMQTQAIFLGWRDLIIFIKNKK